MDKARENNKPDHEYGQLKSSLDKLVLQLRNPADLGLIREELISIQTTVRDSEMSREQKDSLFNLIQIAFENLKKIRELEKQSFEKEAVVNYQTLKNEVDAALQKVEMTTVISEKKEILISVQEDFRGKKMIREQREELYQKVQQAFDRIKQLQDAEHEFFTAESEKNYSFMKASFEQLKFSIQEGSDRNETRNSFNSLLQELRELKLSALHRTELNQLIRSELDLLRSHQESEIMAQQEESNNNYQELKPQFDRLLEEVSLSPDLRQAKNSLIAFQLQMREKQLTREQKEEFRQRMQVEFDRINQKLDEDRSSFEKDSVENYKKLKRKVEEGLKQANESSEYKQTRNYLKTVQAEFKGIRMKKEDREELYTKLQAAFQILNERVEEYFRNKKKYWDIQMQFKISNLEQEIYILERSVDEDEKKLESLKDRLEDLEENDPGHHNIKTLRNRVTSLESDIEEKRHQISDLENDIEKINAKLNPEPEEE
ncbi:MAG: hypothetical protein NTW49_04705 [Bacteroidia bacterium]|nr:hypothetical protein [Bacteroidia bacterium]